MRLLNKDHIAFAHLGEGTKGFLLSNGKSLIFGPSEDELNDIIADLQNESVQWIEIPDSIAYSLQ
jgi:hypothetical protein